MKNIHLVVWNLVETLKWQEKWHSVDCLFVIMAEEREMLKSLTAFSKTVEKWDSKICFIKGVEEAWEDEAGGHYLHMALMRLMIQLILFLWLYWMKSNHMTCAEMRIGMMHKQACLCKRRHECQKWGIGWSCKCKRRHRREHIKHVIGS